MIFEPALLSDFVSGGQEARAGESDLFPSIFFIVDTLHMDPWRRIVEHCVRG